ncbi:MAG: AlkZ family DNA glycosylase [Anaerolineaceae bacterium]|nr:AlkZ family DNA glycosylase [Anaerolineaceae bacterium]MCB9099106.1 AlkZ family DNA glycosylase [Anaerolineales bacterium]
MTIFDIAHLRLHNQGIAPAVMPSPGDVVRRLGAIQAQDYLGTLWALGLRMQQAVEADIEQAIANREIIRTWPMRGTLHFVAPEDVRWMLALLTPRIIAKTARRHQQLELDEATFAQSEIVFAKMLQGGKSLTRPEIMTVLEQAGISTKGQRGYHMLWRAAQNGLICFGPRQGKQDTFVWLNDWLPAGPSLNRAESLAELARRYFTGHGPATVQDFIWWSGLLTADARAAVEMVASELFEAVIDGQTYWLAPTEVGSKAPSPTVYLLPGFDEYLLGYKDRSAVLDPAHANKIAPGGNGMFNPTIVIDGQVVGTWKRTLRKKLAMIELQPFNPLSNAQSEAVAMAAEVYGAFLNRAVSLKFEI